MNTCENANIYVVLLFFSKNICAIIFIKYIYLQKYGTDMLKNSVKKAGLCQK